MFSLRSNLLQVGQADLLRGSFLQMRSMKHVQQVTMYSLRSYVFKSKSINTSLVDTR